MAALSGAGTSNRMSGLERNSEDGESDVSESSPSFSGTCAIQAHHRDTHLSGLGGQSAGPSCGRCMKTSFLFGSRTRDKKRKEKEFDKTRFQQLESWCHILAQLMPDCIHIRLCFQLPPSFWLLSESGGPREGRHRKEESLIPHRHVGSAARSEHSHPHLRVAGEST